MRYTDKIIYDEICCTLDRETIIKKAENSYIEPFEYILDFIKYQYNIEKKDALFTAKRICKYFNV